MDKSSQNLPHALKIRKLQEQKKTKLSLKQKNILSVLFSFLFLSIIGWYLVIFSGLNIILPLLISISSVLIFFQYKKTSAKKPSFQKTNQNHKIFNDYTIKNTDSKKNNKKISSFSSVPKPLYLKSKNIVPAEKTPFSQEKINQPVENAIKIIKSSKKLPETSYFLTKKHSNKIEKGITNLSKQKKVVNK